jgi:hypothetical protein
LLLGLALGSKFEFNLAFALLFVISMICLLVLTAVYKGSFGKVSLGSVLADIRYLLKVY